MCTAVQMRVHRAAVLSGRRGASKQHRLSALHLVSGAVNQRRSRIAALNVQGPPAAAEIRAIRGVRLAAHVRNR